MTLHIGKRTKTGSDIRYIKKTGTIVSSLECWCNTVPKLGQGRDEVSLSQYGVGG